MEPEPIQCHPHRIARFLNQELDEREQALLEAHLGVCRDCQRVLERQTARAEIWTTVKESLSSSDGNQDGSGEIPSSAWLELIDNHQSEDATRFDSVLGFLGPTDDPRMIGRLGAYEIVGVVGQGGMGIVLKGHDRALNRYVAIKVLSPHLAASGSARRRFAREAQAAAAVTHENVIAIHGVAEWNGLPYLVMPYIRGESLQRRLDQKGPHRLHEILRVGRQMAAGLAAAHAQGLVHRDIKPANILLEDGVERLQITDFGLARAVDDASLTRTGVIAGTPQYMSPEQARGEIIDARSDLFSMGSTLYALATGRPPFRAETSYGILRRITDNPQRPIREINPELPDWLAATIDKLLAKQPADRFQTASEVMQIFERCLAHVSQPMLLPLPEQVAALLLPPQPTPDVRPPWPVRLGQMVANTMTGWRGVAIGAILTSFSILVFNWIGPSSAGRGHTEKLNNVMGLTPQPAMKSESTLSEQARSQSQVPSTSETNAPLDWESTASQVETLRRDQERIDRLFQSEWEVPQSLPVPAEKSRP